VRFVCDEVSGRKIYVNSLFFAINSAQLPTDDKEEEEEEVKNTLTHEKKFSPPFLCKRLTLQ
jgi:hypothetical protein